MKHACEVRWIAATKTICKNVSIFSWNGSTFDLLLQMEQNYYSNRLAPENAFLGAGHPVTRP